MRLPTDLHAEFNRLGRRALAQPVRACAGAVLAIATGLGAVARSAHEVSGPVLLGALTLCAVALGWLCREHARLVRLARLADHTRSSVFVTDAALRIEWVNPSFTRLNGYGAGQLQGASPRKLLGAMSQQQREANELAMETIEAAIAARLPFQQLLCARRADGSYFFTRFEGQPMPADGAGLSYLWIQTDQQAAEISRRRLELRARILEAMSSKHELVELLEEMAAALQATNLAVRPLLVLVDRGTRRLGPAVGPSFSRAFERQFSGRRLCEEGPAFLAPLRSGERAECRVLADDPHWAPFQAHLTTGDVLRSAWAVPVFDRDHHVVACVLTFSPLERAGLPDEFSLMNDVAGLLGLALGQGAMERENRTLLGAVQATEAAVVMLDGAGQVQFENGALAALFGEGSRSREPFEAFAQRHLEAGGRAALLEACAQGTSWRGRLQLTEGARAGAALQRWVEASVTQVASADGLRTSGLVTFRDVSEFVRTERFQHLTQEGDRAKVSVAWALAAEGPLEDRLAAALASVFQLEGFGASSRGAIFAREGDAPELGLVSRLGVYSEALRSAKVHVGRGLLGTSALAGHLIVTEDCLEALNDDESHVCEVAGVHGHYVLPLMDRPDHALGLAVLSCEGTPVNEPARIEALQLIAELLTNAIVRDRAEKSLREAKRRADEANRAKSDFLATMSHEIRTPMNGVLGFTQLLLNSELQGEQREHAELIFNSAEALLALLNDILDFSKIEAGKLVIEPRPTAVVERAREAVGLLQPGAERKGVTLTLSADSEVPPGLLVDPMRFRQVLLNLIGNGVKFTHAGAVHVGLTVERLGGAPRLKVTVRDTGVGISSTVLPTLFGKFVQGDGSTSRRFGGTGLGLAISKHLVELMGGTIGAESVEGHGSTFWFSLPLTEATLEGEGHPSQLEPVARRARRVLLAEDNLVNQTLARRVLEKLEATVLVASNGLEAVQLAREHSFDVILMDCQMPELDGLEATRRIRALEAERGVGLRVPIIAVTANAFADDIERCLECGMDAVLTKPFRLRELEQAMHRLDRPKLKLVS